MRDNPSPFYAFRYLVAPIDNQVSLLHFTNKSKEELMKDIFIDFVESKKIVWNLGAKRFIFYGFQRFEENLFVVKFVKEISGAIYVEGEEDVERQDKQSVKFVYLIVDVEKQIILIERNVGVFPKVFKCAKFLETYLRDRMRHFDYSVNIRELPSPKKFWNYVEEADAIYELTMVMNAPNMFNGGKATRNLLKEVKDSVNNEEIRVTLRNSEGLLRLTMETIGEYIKYIQEVGGKYILKIKRDNVPETKTSKDDIARTFITRHKTEEYDEDELKNIQDKVDMIHSIESRDNANTQENEI